MPVREAYTGTRATPPCAVGKGMKAIVRYEYGSVDVVRLAEVDEPPIGDREVRVAVGAAGLDYGVWHLMVGEPYIVRLALGLRAPRNPVLGRDLAGRVEAVGKDVTRFRVGDEVFGVAEGAFAERACAREDQLVLRPPSVPVAQAAVTPVSAITALNALRCAPIAAGHRVLVIGAGGGVGTFAVQIAKVLGAEVTGVCSAAKAERVRAIGADHVIDYRREDFADAGPRHDLIVDTAGNRPLSLLRRALTPTGAAAIVGGEGAGRWFGLGRHLRAFLWSPFLRQKLRPVISMETLADLETVRGWLAAGQVTPVIDRICALGEVAGAIRSLEAGQVTGKVAITV